MLYSSVGNISIDCPLVVAGKSSLWCCCCCRSRGSSWQHAVSVDGHHQFRNGPDDAMDLDDPDDNIQSVINTAYSTGTVL